MKDALKNLAEMVAMYVEISYLSYRHRHHTSFHPSCSYCNIDMSVRIDERSKSYMGPGMSWTYMPTKYRKELN